MTEQLANFGVTTLAEDLDDSETVVTVTSASELPATGNFRMRCEDEIMLVTSRSGADLTVTRGAESTTAASHANGTEIRMVLTAAGFVQAALENSVVAQTSEPSSGDLWYDTDADAASARAESSGTVFPSSPITNTRFYRTDVRGGMWFRYDGTRWVSEQLFSLNSEESAIAASTSYRPAVPTDFNIYVVSFDWNIRLNGSGVWTLGVNTIDFDQATSALGSQSSSGQTADKVYAGNVAIGTVVTTTGGNSTAQVRALHLAYTETSGTATFYGGMRVYYRLIAT